MMLVDKDFLYNRYIYIHMHTFMIYIKKCIVTALNAFDISFIQQKKYQNKALIALDTSISTEAINLLTSNKSIDNKNSYLFSHDYLSSTTNLLFQQ